MLENWGTFSFPRSLSMSVTFFFPFFNTVKKKKSLNAQPFREKKIKNHCNLFILPFVDLN